jgi:surfeit locus 1 family protein
MMSWPVKTKDLTISAVLLTAAAFFVLAALGFWQVYRLEWKTDLLQKIESQMAAPAVALPSHIQDPKEWEYRRVSLSGRILDKKEFLLKPRVKDGRVGYHRIVPLQTGKGNFVFVDLGWSDDERPKPLAEYLSTDGIITLPAKGRFTPENNTATNEWYWADITAMSGAAGLKESQVQPFLIVAGKGVRPDIPNNHLQYAFFWFTMAFAIVIVFFIRFFKLGKRS